MRVVEFLFQPKECSVLRNFMRRHIAFTLIRNVSHLHLKIVVAKIFLKLGHAQINVRTRACSMTFIVRSKQAALTHDISGKEIIMVIRVFVHLLK